jgi:hypothetical protein
MELVFVAVVFSIPIARELAIVTDLQGVGKFFIKDGGKGVPLVVKITGWVFIILPLYPIAYEAVVFIYGGR